MFSAVFEPAIPATELSKILYRVFQNLWTLLKEVIS